ncbi:DUF1848 domain-containing protein [Bacillus solimangrovi]|uniref:DUF1848 domain-containing protein n=1 Tax=Bacillus solimangrovi TaxID=1305675 RepID=A0A1E5LAM6_9BACI|nr:DUF1848 domain-containing protein [Bacillus solimangrovi]OEH91132.1 hypothetical protein BFG57_07105 [Bacillus solimangrovi]
MIISASRRTDIPAFYSVWFMNRIDEGYYVKVNPFNAKQRKVVSLTPENVTCFVFWTKNPKPLMKYLDKLDQLGYYYYFQFTLNDYPKELEPYLPSISSRVNIFKELSRKIGKDKVIWRYDPIILSNVTDVDFHIKKFKELADELKGYTNRVVISFVDMYGKTKNKFKRLEETYDLEFMNLLDPHYHATLNYLASSLSKIARENNLEIQTCAEKIDLDEYDIPHGACIDQSIVSKIVIGEQNQLNKDKNQRKECLCVISEEMGTYDTCKFNCSYCYAVKSEKAVNKTVQKHDPHSPVLIGKLEEKDKADLTHQMSLFD